MTKDSLVSGQPFGNNDDGNKCQLETKDGKSSSFRTLSFLTAKRVIYKFLTCDRIVRVERRCLRYNKEDLAKKLGISSKEFEKLKSPNCYKSIATKITLPLVRLYCSTKWADDEYEEGLKDRNKE